MRTIALTAVLTTGLMLAACSEQGKETNKTESNAADTVEDNAAANAVQEAPVTADLSGYVGKYPFDTVEGVAFLDQPVVKDAVTKAVPDKALTREWLLNAKAGPAVPIFKQGTAVASWGCEEHNCGDHNWTIIADAATETAKICYHDAETMQDQSQWFDGKGSSAMKPDPCPSE